MQWSLCYSQDGSVVSGNKMLSLGPKKPRVSSRPCQFSMSGLLSTSLKWKCKYSPRFHSMILVERHRSWGSPLLKKYLLNIYSALVNTSSEWGVFPLCSQVPCEYLYHATWHYIGIRGSLIWFLHWLYSIFANEQQNSWHTVGTQKAFGE